MGEILIRKCKKEDADDIKNICYRTGYMGEDLTGTDKFNDINLFGLMFCTYYPLYETDNCFVAVDTDNQKVVGYIIGTLNSTRQQVNFIFLMASRIIGRLLAVTSWKYRESFAEVIYMAVHNIKIDDPENLHSDYPSHFHIDILPEYHRMGIGTRLISEFENHIRKNKIKGIHLRTSNKNYSAINFYKKNGYRIIFEEKSKMWMGVEDYKSIIFVKKI